LWKREKTYPTGDLFGAVTGGFIRIQGPLCAAIMKGVSREHPVDLIHLESNKEDIAMRGMYYRAKIRTNCTYWLLISEPQDKSYVETQGLVLSQ
jgi:hypothetical protein